MSGNSNIAWTNKTWNPVRGCERVSEGCRNCYAEVLAARHSYEGGWGKGLAKMVTRPDGRKEARWTGTIRMMSGVLDDPRGWRKPSRIFVNSMSDLFHDAVDEDFIAEVFEVMASCPQHVFQILTKRPARMLQLLAHDLPFEGPNWPLPNVWLGVSVEDQATADERIPILIETPAAVRWISAEPLLGPIDLTGLPVPRQDAFRFNALSDHDDDHFFNDHAKLDWVVVGGESGSDRREMDMQHARGVIDQCRSAGTALFVKQDNGPRPGLQGRFTNEEFALKEYPA